MNTSMLFLSQGDLERWQNKVLSTLDPLFKGMPEEQIEARHEMIIMDAVNKLGGHVVYCDGVCSTPSGWCRFQFNA